MSTLSVGINENAILYKVEVVNNNGSLSVDFNFGNNGSTDNAAPADFDPFAEELDENGYAKTSGKGFDPIIKYWAPKVPDLKKPDGTDRSMAERSKMAWDAAAELQNLLQQIGLCYTTSDKFKLKREEGIEINKDNWSTVILNKEVLDAMTRNLVNQFNTGLGEFLGKKEHALRLLLVRKSAKVHFPGFRMNFVKDNPVVESMEVSKEQSKLKFTTYEISKKLNDGTPVATSTDSKPATPLTEESVFAE